uniref:MIF4G domain-containing protein n=1 Tax=Steinernema glaseri TaxID=37863 RepID=A0A1I8AB74_9BILA
MSAPQSQGSFDNLISLVGPATSCLFPFAPRFGALRDSLGRLMPMDHDFGASTSQMLDNSSSFNDVLQRVQMAIFDYACRKNYLRLVTVCTQLNFPIEEELFLSFMISHVEMYSAKHFRFVIESVELLLKKETDADVHHSLVSILHLSKYLYMSVRVRELNLSDKSARRDLTKQLIKYFPSQGDNPRNIEKRKIVRNHFLRVLSDIDRVFARFAVIAASIWKAYKLRNPEKMPKADNFPVEPAWILLQDHLKGNMEPDEETLLTFVDSLNISQPANLSSALLSYEDSIGGICI